MIKFITELLGRSLQLILVHIRKLSLLSCHYCHHNSRLYSVFLTCRGSVVLSTANGDVQMFNTVKHTPIFSGRIFKKKIEVTYIKFHPSGKELPVLVEKKTAVIPTAPFSIRCLPHFWHKRWSPTLEAFNNFCTIGKST